MRASKSGCPWQPSTEVRVLSHADFRVGLLKNYCHQSVAWLQLHKCLDKEEVAISTPILTPTGFAISENTIGLYAVCLRCNCVGLGISHRSFSGLLLSDKSILARRKQDDSFSIRGALKDILRLQEDLGSLLGIIGN